MKKLFKKMMAVLCAVGMLLPSVPANAAEAKDINSKDVHLLQTLAVYDALPSDDDTDDASEEDIKYEALIYDGTKKLEENVDYTITRYEASLENASSEEPTDEEDYLENDEYQFDTTIIIKGINNYKGEIAISDDDIYECEKKEKNGWVIYITSQEDESCVLGGYKGAAESLDIPSTITIGGGDYTVDEVLPGCFVNLPNLKSVDFDEVEIYPYTFINCPALVCVSSKLEEAGLITEDVPGPFVLGDLDGTLSVKLSFAYKWEYGNEKYITLGDYCKKYGYQVEDDSKIFQDEGWIYRIDKDLEIAVISSYTGTDAKVTVPTKVECDDYEYEISDVEINAFNGLTTLEEIDLGVFPLKESLCVNCPNLKKITTSCRDFELKDPIVSGLAPAKDALTVCAYSSVFWDEEDEEGNLVAVTIQEYCSKSGYKYEEKKLGNAPKNMEIGLSYNYSEYYSTALAGITYETKVFFEADGDEWSTDDDEINAQSTNWVSDKPDVASVTTDGMVTISPNAKTGDIFRLSGDLIVEGETIPVTQTFTAIGRLFSPKKSYSVTIGGSGVQLACQQKVLTLDGEIETTYLPSDVEYAYEVISGDVEVSEEGVVTAKEGATAGNASVGMTVNGFLDGASAKYNYKLVYNIKIVNPAQAPADDPNVEVNNEKLVIYGYKGSNAQKQVESFVASLPEAQRDLVVYEEYDEEFDLNEYDPSEYYKDYLNEVDKGMSSNQKYDIILLPGATLKETLSKSYVADLESVGFKDTDYAQAYDYTKSRGSLNGKLKAVTWEINPGCFVYSKSIAQDLFGASDPETVQNHVKDWETFSETASLCKENDVYLASTPNNVKLALHDGTSIVDSDKSVALGGKVKDYLELQEKFVEMGAVSEDYDEWISPDWIELSEDVFGYFADARIVLNDIAEYGAYSLYDVCQGPVAYEGTYPDYYAATNNVNNKGLALKFLKSVLNDSDAMENENFVANNQSFVQKMSEDDVKYTQYDAIAKAIPNGCIGSLVECYIEECLVNEYDYDVREEEEYGVEDVLEELVDIITEEFSDVTVTAKDKEPNNPSEPSDPGNSKDPTKNPTKNPTKDPQTAVEEHLFSDTWTVDIAATCSKPGSKSKHCKDKGCTEKKDVTVIPATGKHTYGAWTVTKNATCNQPGERVHTCSVCKKQDKEAIPALGFVKGGTFVSGNHNYTVLSVKGKKGSVVWTGMVVNNKKSVSIPKTVKAGGITFTITEIAANACMNNKSLKTVTIPANVTKIGTNAFSGCSKIKTIKIKSTKLKKVGKNAIKGISKKAQIKVPKKKLKAYKKLFKKKTGFKKTMKIKK